MSDDRILFLLDLERKQLFPFSTFGFRFSDRHPHVILREYANSIFLDSTGSIQKIKNIQRSGRGLFVALKALARISNDISVELEIFELPLTLLKEGVIAGLETYQKTVSHPNDSWSLANIPMNEIQPSISQAKDAMELYSVLNPPPIRDCLDLL